jgi:hypothetical protein
VALLVGEARLRQNVQRARAGVGVGVAVTISARVVLVPGHRRDGGDVIAGVRRGGRARDIGDRRNVIPIEAVAEAEDGHAAEQAKDAKVHLARAYREWSQ